MKIKALMRWGILGLFLGTTSAHADWTLAFRKELAVLPGDARFIEREARQDGNAVRVQGVFFDARKVRPRVVDNPTPNRGTLAEAMQAAGAIAGVNGGYFHANWTPVGLQIADGKTIHPFETAKLLSGIFVVTKGKPRLVRSSRYTPSKADSDALQAGPFLVDDGLPPKGLNTERLARRTIIATDARGHWAILLLSHTSLADAGAILASREIFPDFEIAQALNLDGGSSSALWVATEPKPFSMRALGAVRNYLALFAE